MNDEQLEFIVFCIESFADTYKIDARKVYETMHSNNDYMINYIVKNFDILHSQGKGYIVNDLHEIMEDRGIKI